MLIESNNRMPLYTKNDNHILVCFNEKLVIKDNQTLYQYDGVLVQSPYTYNSLIASIIKDKYDNDSMQAIINNYLSDTDNIKYKEEFDTMQNYRKAAKDAVKIIFNV